ncbi:hypothetical protein C3L33_14425, partial [Rhododendron williamsianum]
MSCSHQQDILKGWELKFWSDIYRGNLRLELEFQTWFLIAVDREVAVEDYKLAGQLERLSSVRHIRRRAGCVGVEGSEVGLFEVKSFCRGLLEEGNESVVAGFI